MPIDIDEGLLSNAQDCAFNLFRRCASVIRSEASLDACPTREALNKCPQCAAKPHTLDDRRVKKVRHRAQVTLRAREGVLRFD